MCHFHFSLAKLLLKISEEDDDEQKIKKFEQKKNYIKDSESDSEKGKYTITSIHVSSNKLKRFIHVCVCVMRCVVKEIL